MKYETFYLLKYFPQTSDESIKYDSKALHVRTHKQTPTKPKNPLLSLDQNSLEYELSSQPLTKEGYLPDVDGQTPPPAPAVSPSPTPWQTHTPQHLNTWSSKSMWIALSRVVMSHMCVG